MVLSKAGPSTERLLLATNSKENKSKAREEMKKKTRGMHYLSKSKQYKKRNNTKFTRKILGHAL